MKGNSRKIKRAVRPAPVRVPTGFDATPERLAKEPDNDVADALREPGTPIGYVRRFRASHLDRWHSAGLITYYQWMAGNIYRETHARCQFPLSVVAAYGERSGSGEHPGAFGVGLPRQEAQLRAREQMRSMRSQWPQFMQGFMDRMLIHDSLPRYGGNQRMRKVAQVRNALDELCGYLRLCS